MQTPTERINNLLSDLRLQPVDFDEIYNGRNKLNPLESVELFLDEELRLRIEKQNRLRRRNARLPYEKTIEGFDFGFQRSVSKEQMLRLSDMTRVEQAYNICFLILAKYYTGYQILRSHSKKQGLPCSGETLPGIGNPVFFDILINAFRYTHHCF